MEENKGKKETWRLNQPIKTVSFYHFDFSDIYIRP